MALFNAALKAQQRVWAAAQAESAAAGLLRAEVAARLADCVADLKTPPRRALVLGAPCASLVAGLHALGVSSTVADDARTAI